MYADKQSDCKDSRKFKASKTKGFVGLVFTAMLCATAGAEESVGGALIDNLFYAQPIVVAASAEASQKEAKTTRGSIFRVCPNFPRCSTRDK